jgi:hypothetical protein
LDLGGESGFSRCPLIDGESFPAAFQCNYWAWSHDSKYIYCDSPAENEMAVVRLRVADDKIEKVASLKAIRRGMGAFGEWFGLGPGDAPLMLRDTGNQQIYALDWEAP